MIEKIISDGQTGAGQACLDCAIKNGIPHDGWIPKVSMSEKDRLLENYSLIELPTKSTSECIKKNIKESNGTLILIHNMLSGRYLDAMNWASRYGKPVLYIESTNQNHYNSAAKICIWVSDRNIRVLNIIGPRLSEDPDIYAATIKILDSVFYLNQIEHNMEISLNERSLAGIEVCADDLPDTMDEAVDIIIGDMDFKNKAAISRLTENNLLPLQLTLGLYIKKRLKTWSTNEQFKKECMLACREACLDGSNPAMVIVKRIWERLKETHTLRVVK